MVFGKILFFFNLLKSHKKRKERQNKFFRIKRQNLFYKKENIKQKHRLLNFDNQLEFKNLHYYNYDFYYKM